MAFTEVSWTNGDYVEETKLDQMVASDVHVREESNYWHLLMNVGSFTSNNNSSSHSVIFKVDDATTIATITDQGDFCENDIDLDSAGIADGLHTLDLYFNFTYNRTWRFYKTPDMNYLTIWLNSSTSGSIGDYDHTASEITIIGHRQTKSWTV